VTAIDTYQKEMVVNENHMTDELKAEMETIQQHMVEAKKKRTYELHSRVKRLCKEFGFTAGC